MKSGRLAGLEQRQSALDLQLRAIIPDYDAESLQSTRSTRVRLQQSAEQQIMSQFSEGGCVVDASQHLSAEDMRATLRILISSQCGAERQERPFLLSGATICGNESQSFGFAAEDVLYSIAGDMGGMPQQQEPGRRRHSRHYQELQEQNEQLREQVQDMQRRSAIVSSLQQSQQSVFAAPDQQKSVQQADPGRGEAPGQAESCENGFTGAKSGSASLSKHPVRCRGCESNTLRTRSAVPTGAIAPKRALSCQVGEQPDREERAGREIALQATDLREKSQPSLRQLAEGAGNCDEEQEMNGTSFDTSLSLHSQAEDYDEYCENARREAQSASALPLQSAQEARSEPRSAVQSGKCAVEPEKVEKTPRQAEKSLTPREYAALLNASENGCQDAVVDLGPSVKARIVQKPELPAERVIKLKSRRGGLLIGLFSGFAARVAQGMASCGGKTTAGEADEQLPLEKTSFQERNEADSRAQAIKRQIEAESAPFSTFGTYDLFKQLMQQNEPKMVMIDKRNAGPLMRQLGTAQANTQQESDDAIEIEDADGRAVPILSNWGEISGDFSGSSGHAAAGVSHSASEPLFEPLIEQESDTFPTFRPDGLFSGLASRQNGYNQRERAAAAQPLPANDSGEQSGRFGAAFPASSAEHALVDQSAQKRTPQEQLQSSAAINDKIDLSAPNRASLEPAAAPEQLRHRPSPEQQERSLAFPLPLPVRKHSVRYPAGSPAGVQALLQAKPAEAHALSLTNISDAPGAVPSAAIMKAPPRKRRTSAAFLAWQAENDAMNESFAAQSVALPLMQFPSADGAFSNFNGNSAQKAAQQGEAAAEGINVRNRKLISDESSLEDESCRLQAALQRETSFSGPADAPVQIAVVCRAPGRAVVDKRGAAAGGQDGAPLKAGDCKNEQDFETSGSRGAQKGPKTLEIQAKAVTEKPGGNAQEQPQNRLEAASDSSEEAVRVLTTKRARQLVQNSKIEASKPAQAIQPRFQQGAGAQKGAISMDQGAETAVAELSARRARRQQTVPKAGTTEHADLQEGAAQSASKAANSVDNLILFKKPAAHATGGPGLLDFQTRLYNEQAVDGVISDCGKERWRISTSLAGRMMRSYQALCESQGVQGAQ